MKDYLAELKRRVVGQDDALQAIVPFIYQFESSLREETRPAGALLLLGPTGSGKTKTAEALAEVVHGSRRNVLRINCAEYQLEHEVAKLIGAPPGYLGHNTSKPLLRQENLTAVTSQTSTLSIILFDEVEKAHFSIWKLLLGVLDSAQMRNGEGEMVNFERSMIFFTSNLGARQIAEAQRPSFGLDKLSRAGETRQSKLNDAAIRAAKKHFSPEFINRLDAMPVYRSLTPEAIRDILDLQLAAYEKLIERRLGTMAFKIEVAERAKEFLLRKGVSQEYGARELKRVISRYLQQPIALMQCRGELRPGEVLTIEHRGSEDELTFLRPREKVKFATSE